MLLSPTALRLAGRRWWREGSPGYTRANKRRLDLERKRLGSSLYYSLPPVEPSPEEAVRLYRQLIKAAESRLVVTDKAYFRRVVRNEFEITALRTSKRVRGIMYEKGKWMLENNLGGVI